jgi:hypothetical protein
MGFAPKLIDKITIVELQALFAYHGIRRSNDIRQYGLQMAVTEIEKRTKCAFFDPGQLYRLYFVHFLASLHALLF